MNEQNMEWEEVYIKARLDRSAKTDNGYSVVTFGQWAPMIINDNLIVHRTHESARCDVKQKDGTSEQGNLEALGYEKICSTYTYCRNNYNNNHPDTEGETFTSYLGKTILQKFGRPKTLSVEEMCILSVKAMNKESIRNGNTGMKHEYSDVCSCGVCHTAIIISEQIKKALDGA